MKQDPLFDYGFISTVGVNIVLCFLSLRSHTALFGMCLSLTAVYENEVWWSRRRQRVFQKVGNFYRFSLLLYLEIPVDDTFFLLFHNISIFRPYCSRVLRRLFIKVPCKTYRLVCEILAFYDGWREYGFGPRRSTMQPFLPCGEPFVSPYPTRPKFYIPLHFIKLAYLWPFHECTFKNFKQFSWRLFLYIYNFIIVSK